MSERADRASAFAAAVGDDLMVLDLKADRYFLGLGSAATLASPARPGDLVVDPEARRWRAKGSTYAEGRARVGPVCLSLLCLRRVSHILRARSFEVLVETIRTAPLSRAQRPRHPESLLASFEAARPFYPHGRLCRLDAPSLCLLFRSYGHPARLVFGARLQPFAAHCWAELHGRVLNEATERVAQYTPLLIV